MNLLSFQHHDYARVYSGLFGVDSGVTTCSVDRVHDSTLPWLS